MNVDEIANKISFHTVSDFTQCDVWIIDVRNFYSDTDIIRQCLSSDEIIKAQNIKNSKAKELFCLRKGIKRIIHGKKLNILPQTVKYQQTAYGKPFIYNDELQKLHFNISHSKEYLLVGTSSNTHIGVDIEKLNPAIKHSVVAASIFTPDETALYESYSQTDKLRSFYKAWVQKEAVSKALGVGISIGFNTFKVNIDPNITEEEYILYIESLKSYVNVRVKLEREYFFSVALVV